MLDQSAQQYAMPQGITINGDNGDYYVTADVATYSSVFRIHEVDMSLSMIYTARTLSHPGHFELCPTIDSLHHSD